MMSTQPPTGSPATETSGSSSAKVSQSAALTMATLSVSMAALLLAVSGILQASGAAQGQTGPAPLPREPITLLAVILVYAASLCLDWVIDSYTLDDWRWIFGKHQSDAMLGAERTDGTPHRYKRDQWTARRHLYNGGYFFLAVFIASLHAILLYQVVEARSSVFFRPWVVIATAVTSFFIIYQMMTYDGRPKLVFGFFWIPTLVVLFRA